jgi:hypothetical protein
MSGLSQTVGKVQHRAGNDRQYRAGEQRSEKLLPSLVTFIPSGEANQPASINAHRRGKTKGSFGVKSNNRAKSPTKKTCFTL